MTMIPNWMMAATMACFILVAISIVALLIGLIVTLAKTQELIESLSHGTLPKIQALSDNANEVVARLERIADITENQVNVILPKAERIADRTDQLLGQVESRSDRIGAAIVHTAENVAATSSVIADTMANSMQSAAAFVSKLTNNTTVQRATACAIVLFAARFAQQQMHRSTNGTHPNGASKESDT